MDGVTVGHPRCNVDQCTNRLRSPRDRFCAAHDSERHVCAIHGCRTSPTDGRRTCNTPEHRHVEEERRQQGQAIFRLQRRLDNRNAASLVRGLSASAREADPACTDDHAMELSEIFDEPPVPSRAKPRASKKKSSSKKDPNAPAKLKLKNALGRRYTHCQQLMFRPCGVILARATFFEAESVSNARVRLASLSVVASHTHHAPNSSSSTARSRPNIPGRSLPFFSTTTTVNFSSTSSQKATNDCSGSAYPSTYSMRFASIRSQMASAS